MPTYQLFKTTELGRFVSVAEEKLGSDEEAALRARELSDQHGSRFEVWCSGKFVFETTRVRKGT
jgi:hypothetical protein